MLFVISTPIGNLSDITLRALETLKEVDFIVCEDTRVTGVLLKHYEIRKEMFSLNASNENAKIKPVIERILAGCKCALLSDSGTPAISDPGIRLISAALANDIKVVPVPGASALTAALTSAGYPTDQFVFYGFIPQKKGRQKLLASFSDEEKTIVIYESTYRIMKLLKELNEYMPGRQIAVCRELTKKFEEIKRGTASELINYYEEHTTKGEFAIVIAPKNWK